MFWPKGFCIVFFGLSRGTFSCLGLSDVAFLVCGTVSRNMFWPQALVLLFLELSRIELIAPAGSGCTSVFYSRRRCMYDQVWHVCHQVQSHTHAHVHRYEIRVQTRTIPKNYRGTLYTYVCICMYVCILIYLYRYTHIYTGADSDLSGS